jgi:hypothetical protein
MTRDAGEQVVTGKKCMTESRRKILERQKLNKLLLWKYKKKHCDGQAVTTFNN